MTRWTLPCVLSAAVALLAGAALGVRPAEWAHSTEAEFNAGELEQTVTTSLGQVRLARKMTLLVESDNAPAVVSALAVAGRTVYAGAGNEPVVYKVADGKAVKLAELPSTMICSLVWTGRDLVAGTGGEEAGIYRVGRDGKVRKHWAAEGVKYVWAVLRRRDGSMLAATGPEGKVFAVDKNGKGQVIFHVEDLCKNVLCLLPGKGNTLYAGTDEKGLVLEIDTKAKTGRVLLDADEKEIAALAIGDDGVILAATSDASKASAEGGKQPATTREGRAAKASETRPAEGKAATQPAKKPDADKKKDADKAKAEPKDKPAAKKPAKKPAEKKDGKEDKGDKKKDEGKSDGKDGNGKKEKKEAEAGNTKAIKRVLRIRRAKGPSSSPSTAPGGGSSTPANGPTRTVRIVRSSGPPRSASSSGASAPPSGKGNAVYAIRPDGLVETVFRRPVTILGLVRSGDRLLLATGNGGGIYSATLDGDEIALLVDTEAKQVTCLVPGGGGQMLFATANEGSIGRIEPGVVKKGTYVSQALDAKQIAQWGTMRVAGDAPAGTSVTIATRSGNLSKPDEKTWSSWSKEMPLESGFLPIGTPAGRFFQYRLTLTSNGKASPVVEGVRTVYQMGNLPPVVAGIAVQASPKGRSSNETAGGAKAWRHIAIKAGDVNGDKLRFILAFREIGTEPWIQITDRLPAPKYVWDTRSVSDGRYELRVTASDDPVNPKATAGRAARISEPITIDNTAPAVRNLTAKADGRQVKVTGLAEDATSRVATIHYAVNSQSKWVAVMPSDGICDSGRERFAFEAEDVKPGPCRIAVRVSDVYGNVGYGSVIVSVK